MGILSDILNDAPAVIPLGNVSRMERCLASDRWITIHPHGDEEDYRRIEIDDNGTILKGGAVALQGTNIRDLGKNAREKRLEIEGKKFKTEEEYQEKEKRLKQDLDEINLLIESDKYEDLNRAVKKLIDNGVFYTKNYESRKQVEQGIKEKRPETYKDILDTKTHHKDMQAFQNAWFKVKKKIDHKHNEARIVLEKMYNEKKHGRYNKLAKMYEENNETLKFLIAGEKDQLNSLKEWAKSKIYRK
jgi:hypothetical protein